MSQARVSVLVGSLRAASYSRRVAHALIKRAPSELSCSIVEIGELPLYNEDLDTATPPPAWTSFRSAVAKSDAVLFVTPEYNRSIPGGLKNAVDVGSRPMKKSVWAKKPTGVVSVTPSRLGAFGANQALRQTFVFLDMPVMQQPEVYLSNASEIFAAEGQVNDPKVEELLGSFMQAFNGWVGQLRASAKNAR
jgi:NAD(P)H-dependent FMN reductase